MAIEHIEPPASEPQASEPAAAETPTMQTRERLPKPRRMTLPLGERKVDVYAREQLARIYGCSHGELGRLLARRVAPLPVRVEGFIIWFADEVLAAREQVHSCLKGWRRQ